MTGTNLVGIDVGGTNFRIGLVSQSPNLLSFETKSSDCLRNEDAISSLRKTIFLFLNQYGNEKPAAISIGFPSLIRKDGKAAVSTPNLPYLDNVDIVTPLRNDFQCPVFLSKDADLLLLCAMKQAGVDLSKDAIGLFYGTGIGNALWIKGGFLKGKNGVAGELGHIPVKGIHEVCCCGNIGCMETIASGNYLTTLKKGYYPMTELKNLFVKHWQSPKLEEFVEGLAIPAATEINILDPDYVFIGGGLVNMDHFPRETLIRHIYRMTRKPFPADTLDIRFLKSGQESGVLGAAYWAMMQLEKQK